MRREKNEEAEREKRRKERALEDQYTMRFSNAAGRGGLGQQPWYASMNSKTARQDEATDKALAFPEMDNKNVWGNEDPLRNRREESRIASNDPFAFMQKAQLQLKKSKEDKKIWAAERDRELMELKAAQRRSSRREGHGERRRCVDDEDDDHKDRSARKKERSSLHKRRRKSRSRSNEPRYGHPSLHQRIERKQSPSRHRRERRTFDQE